MRGVLRSGLGLRAAFGVALAADTVSIAVMELVDNAVVLAVPGALDAGLTSPLFWASLAFSLAAAFVVTLPVNRWMISRGLGHARAHQHHAHATSGATGPDHDSHHDADSSHRHGSDSDPGRGDGGVPGDDH